MLSTAGDTLPEFILPEKATSCPGSKNRIVRRPHSKLSADRAVCTWFLDARNAQGPGIESRRLLFLHTDRLRTSMSLRLFQ